MPRNRRCFIHNTLVEICFRIEAGLPLVATRYMKLLMEGILARAAEVYPVTICGHVHPIVNDSMNKLAPFTYLPFFQKSERRISPTINVLALS